MRFSIIAAVAAFSSTALAQGLLDQIPQCAADIQTTTNFAVQLCNLQNVDVNTQPSCPSGSATPSAGNSSSASMTSSGRSAASGSTSMTASASAAGSTGAAPYQTAGAGIGLGVAMVGLLAAL
ncbi:unnamed protein product [Alternaria alternata]